MPEIKRIFDEKYESCNVESISKYETGQYLLGSISNPIVFSVDCLFDKHRELRGNRCDEFVFFDLGNSITGIYLIERKKTSQDLEKVRKQLDGGARFIKSFLTEDPATDNELLDFMPVWVSKGLKSSARHKLKSVRITLRNRHKLLRHVNIKRTLPKFK